jgi:hypothetical protein
MSKRPLASFVVLRMNVFCGLATTTYSEDEEDRTPFVYETVFPAPVSALELV